MARHHTNQLVKRAMKRLNEKGRGILLMHDIHPATAMALPMLLKELKAQGYHVVQVVPAGERPASVPKLVASSPDKGAWPRVLKVSAAAVTDGTKPTLRHHVKKAHAGKRRQAAVAVLDARRPVMLQTASGNYISSSLRRACRSKI